MKCMGRILKYVLAVIKLIKLETFLDKLVCSDARLGTIDLKSPVGLRPREKW